MIKTCIICKKEYHTYLRIQKCCSRTCMGIFLSRINAGKHLSEETKDKLRVINTGKVLSKETRLKISMGNKGKKYSPQTIEKYRLSKLGNKNPMYGKIFSKEHIRKLREARKRQIFSEDTKKKISIAHKGKSKPKMSGERLIRQRHLLRRIRNDPAIREKMSISQRLRTMPLEVRKKISKSNTGKHHSEETKRKLSAIVTNAFARDPSYKQRVSLSLKKFYTLHPEKHPNYIMIKKGFISKPQKSMYVLIKEKFPTAIMNYPLITKEGVLFPDVAIPELHICFEFDGKYWHKHRISEDLVRKERIVLEGWEVFSFNEDTFDKISKVISQIQMRIV